MPKDVEQPLKAVIDREMLMRLKICAACERKFNMGEPVVLACGAWEGAPRYIHEEEAVFDADRNIYVERKCYEAGR